MSEPKSTKLNEYTTKEYWVTAARWYSPITGENYEIGIRHKALNGDFTLLRGDWNHQSVQEVSEAVCKLLDSGFDVEWIREHIR